MNVQLHEGVFWVGAIDWYLRDFHGYITQRGATYNSYLIVDEKVALIDTVKAPFVKEMTGRIRQIIGSRKIDYLICNHIEMDHSGSIVEMVEQTEGVKIFSTERAKTGLLKYYGKDLPVQTVKTGESISLGKKTLQFLEAPMLHWPDSMFTYCPENKILFPNDGFGQHIASSGRFDDEVDQSELMFEAAKYYANLLMHLSPLVQNILRKVTELKLNIAMIAPSHGVIWRNDPDKIIQAYNNWSMGKAKEKILVIYDTMWKSTDAMAHILGETAMDEGIETKLLKLRENHRSDIMTEILDAKGFMIGSPTIHQNMFPTMADFLWYMKGLKPQKKAVSAFGSYGWSGEAVEQMMELLKPLPGARVIEPGVRSLFMPDEKDKAKLTELAKKMIASVKTLDK